MNLKVFEQRIPPTRRPFRIIETTATIDGPRDRLTDKTFTTIGEAEDFIRSEQARKVKP